MQGINTFEFYRLGMTVHPLAKIKSDTPLSEALPMLTQAWGALQAFERAEFVPLTVSRSALDNLIKAIDACLDFGSGPTSEQWAAPLDWRAFRQLSEGLATFEAVFAAELAVLSVYTVPQRGIFSTPHLIDSADLQLSDTARGMLSSHVRVDFRHAGRCIAFQLPTAAAFHLWRATECAMHEWYDIVTLEPRPDKFPTWSNYLRGLRSHGADEKICAVLEQISTLHRNPISHPELFIGIDEAISLLGVAQDAISSIGRDMGDRLAFALGQWCPSNLIALA